MNNTSIRHVNVSIRAPTNITQYILFCYTPACLNVFLFILFMNNDRNNNNDRQWYGVWNMETVAAQRILNKTHRIECGLGRALCTIGARKSNNNK